ncbi:DUF4386 domain-containing protein [Paenibacillus chartarius]|uniref:DUF4386 domain-containing protein n=1 Tax=Paenibacillus chartarius TaxID=747481 RepID=A0ABV6DQR9_9BACL
MNEKTAARTAGLALILMTLAASFSYGYVHGSLVVPGEAQATLQRLTASSMLFRAEIFGWLLILILDIVVAWAFYLFLKPIHHGLSLLAAWLRLSYASILGIAIMCLIMVSLLTNGSSAAASLFAAGRQLPGLAMLFLKAFESVWSVGLIVFGGHLLLVGCLALRSPAIPRIIGILLLAAGAGYVAVHLGRAFAPEYAALVTMLEYGFMLPMIAGELGFALWLLFKPSLNSAK